MLKREESSTMIRQFGRATRYADSRTTGSKKVHAGESKQFNYEETTEKLGRYYRTVKRQILRYQSPTTGLFPSDLSQPNSQEAHVRDSVYCAVAVWALSQSFKRIDNDKGVTYELAQSAVKCMRGILACWLKQADKVEKFKQNQSPKNALHSKFHMITGDVITRDEDYEHLQLDCVALYLIYLVQMIQSGLQIIFTTDEVNFVQNLVFYVERAYRTSDYGMWERGSKYNNGSSELHASSIGIAKAALESINGSNMFGDTGAHWSVIFIDIDAHYRNRTTFDTILPRESASKNTDASLIPTVGWPAFAVHEESLVNKTLDKITRKLNGKYGYKRFLRDGCYTVLEDRTRKYYHAAEIKTFDGIECEWPLFIIYLIIDSMYHGDHEAVRHYQHRLAPLLKASDDGPVVPKYYYVPRDHLQAERADPGSQRKVASGEGSGGNLFLWGQSVYIISQLLVDGLLNINELDPIRRYLPAAERPRPSSRYSSFQRGSTEESSPTDLVIQVALIAESVRLQQMLATYGIQTQTPHQVEPIQIWPPSELARAYAQLGVNHKLGLSGRPPRPIGGLGTAKIYRACGYTFVCYPLLFEVSDFYLSQDMELVLDDVKIMRASGRTLLSYFIRYELSSFYLHLDQKYFCEDIKTDLAFLGKCWKLAGRPTFCMVIRESNLRGPNARYIFQLLAQFKRGDCDGIKVRLGRLQEFISSACIEHLDFMTIESSAETTYHRFVEKDMERQFRSLTNINKILKVDLVEGWVDFEELKQQSNSDLADLLRESSNMYCRTQVLQVLLNREGLYYRVDGLSVEQRLEDLIRAAATNQLWAVVRFSASLLGKVVDSLAPSITTFLVRGKQLTIGVFGEDEEVIDKPISPAGIKAILYTKCFPHDAIQAVLQQEIIINIGKFITTHTHLFDGMLKIRIGWLVQAMKMEANYVEGREISLSVLSPSAIKKLLLQMLKKPPPASDYRTMLWNRQLDGALNRMPEGFYKRVWKILERTPGGIKVSGYHLPQQPTLSDMTEYELNFPLLIEQMLSKIVNPAYRQMMVESFMVVATILDRNKELSFRKMVDMDQLVHSAFRLFEADEERRSPAADRQAAADQSLDHMAAFYNTRPNVQFGTTTYIAKAVVNDLLDGQIKADTNCLVS